MWINLNALVKDGHDDLDEIARNVKPVRVGPNPSIFPAYGMNSQSQEDYLASIAAGISETVRPDRAVVVLTSPPNVAQDIADGLNPRTYLEQRLPAGHRDNLRYEALNDRLVPKVGHVGVLVVHYKG